MTLIIWDNTVPSDTSAGALPAPFSMQSIPHSMRTMKEAIATGFGEAFYWPGSAASQGRFQARLVELIQLQVFDGLPKRGRMHDAPARAYWGVRNAQHLYILISANQEVDR